MLVGGHIIFPPGPGPLPDVGGGGAPFGPNIGPFGPPEDTGGAYMGPELPLLDTGGGP